MEPHFIMHSFPKERLALGDSALTLYAKVVDLPLTDQDLWANIEGFDKNGQIFAIYYRTN